MTNAYGIDIDRRRGSVMVEELRSIAGGTLAQVSAHVSLLIDDGILTEESIVRVMVSPLGHGSLTVSDLEDYIPMDAGSVVALWGP